MARPLKRLGPDRPRTYDYSGPGHRDLNSKPLIRTGLPRGRTHESLPPHTYEVDRNGFQLMPEGPNGIRDVLSEARGRMVEVIFQIPGEMSALELSVLPEPLMIAKSPKVYEGELRASGEPVVIEWNSGESFYDFEILVYRYREFISN